MLRPWIIVVLIFLTITNESSSTPAQITAKCGNVTCSNTGMCKADGNGGLRCLCQLGFTGTTCGGDFDECHFGNPCMRRGYCHNSIGSYRCECLEGWSGDTHCEIKDPSSTVHRCMPGWLGGLCQDQCLNDSMCRPTEFCKRRGRGLRCLCAPGWHGVNCSTDMDECARSPCPNNATCMNTPGSYKCLCLSGWKGDSCEKDINECLMNKCEHSLACKNEQGYYNCTCAPGWEGDNCDEDINECEQKPCNATLACANSLGSFSCKQMSSNEKSDGRKTKIILFAVLGSVLTVCSMVTCLGILKYKWNVICEVLKGKDASQ